MPTIHPLTDADLPAWDAYVNAHPQATFFHLAGWREVLEEGLGHETHYLCAKDGDGLKGVLPLARVRSRLFGDALVSTPFCVYGGALAEDESVCRLLEDHAAALAQELGVDYLELRNRDRRREGWPGKEFYVTFRKAISPDEDANMKAIPRKQRAMVRKGIKAGLEARIEPDLAHFYPVYAESVRNLGTPVFPRRYFSSLLRTFGEQCEIQTTYLEQRPVATVMSFYFRDEVLPYYGGGVPLARKVKAYDFQYWEVMRRACRRGVKTFDYGRSKAGTGSFSFKKNWGFTPVPLNYQYHLVRASEIPQVNPLNPKYRLMIEAWKRLPLPVANRLGPLISRSLG